MRRVIVIAVAGLSLAGCFFSFVGQLQVGAADRAGSAGIGPPRRRCRHHFGTKLQDALFGRRKRLPIMAFSVTYTMNKFQPATVPVQVVHVPGDLTTSGSTRVDPNPVVAELQPRARRPRAARKVHRPRKPRPPKDAGAPGRCGIAVPRTRAGGRAGTDTGRPRQHRLAGATARPLIACAAAEKVPIVRRCNVPTLRMRAPFARLHGCRAGKRHVNERSSPRPCPSDDRSVRPDDQLFAGVGHRPLRSALPLLHVGRHDILTQGRSARARGARPAVFGVHRQGRAKASAYRRRTAGPAQRDGAGALALAPPRHRRPQ